MKRFKRIGILAGVLAVICVGILVLNRYEEKQEQIQNTDAVVLELPATSVERLSWQVVGGGLSFHRDEGSWYYDEDAAFPVSEDKIGEILSRYEAFAATFIIENVEDYSQYGLEEPEGVLNLTTADGTVEIRLGAFSKMDQQRYVDIGDGNVYLVATDPMDDLATELSAMICHDTLPQMETVTGVRFEGQEHYSICREEESGNSYSAEDVYYAQLDGQSLPLDSLYMEDYLDTIAGLALSEYASYNVTQEELEEFGLDAPLLTVTVDYTEPAEDEQAQPVTGTLVLSIGRNTEEQAAYEAALAAEEDLPDVTKYVRIGDSQIVYKLGEAACTTLMGAGYDELRHKEVFWADFSQVTQIDVTLEEENHTLLRQMDEEDEDSYLWTCGDEEISVSGVQSALEELCADSFTDELPDGKEEIALTVYLDNENFPRVQIQLYRYDGSFCLAVVDGKPVSLIPRSQAVELIEAVQSIVLNG